MATATKTPTPQRKSKSHGLANELSCFFKIKPQLPIRRRLQGLPQFVVTRGGEYFFMPGLRAQCWLADLNA
jgi:hypothetical protein